jgi:hypothetical protein
MFLLFMFLLCMFLLCNFCFVLVMSAGLGAVHVRSDVVSHKEEVAMLASDIVYVNTPHGLNMCMGYFLSRNFFIRAAQEMRKVNNNNFQIMEDEFGDECLRYFEHSDVCFLYLSFLKL